jgi:hypothetical protein
MFLPLALVLLLALLWTVYWFVASGNARSRLQEERAAQSAQGLTLACTDEAWGGYPFHFEFTCSSPIVTHGSGAELRSGKLLLVALAYAPWQVAALLDGPTTLTTKDIPPTKIEHQRALAAVTFGKSPQPSVSAELPAVAIAGFGHADKLMVHWRPSTEGGTDIAVALSGANYQPPGRPPLAIADGNLLGKLTPELTFKLDHFELKQGDLRYWGSGTLALDQDHRVSGQIDTETNDIKALLAVVGPHLDLSESKMANLRTMLGLLGNAAKAPIIAKDGVLYLGPFKIAELTPLY